MATVDMKRKEGKIDVRRDSAQRHTVKEGLGHMGYLFESLERQQEELGQQVGSYIKILEATAEKIEKRKDSDIGVEDIIRWMWKKLAPSQIKNYAKEGEHIFKAMENEIRIYEIPEKTGKDISELSKTLVHQEGLAESLANHAWDMQYDLSAIMMRLDPVHDDIIKWSESSWLPQIKKISSGFANDTNSIRAKAKEIAAEMACTGIATGPSSKTIFNLELPERGSDNDYLKQLAYKYNDNRDNSNDILITITSPDPESSGLRMPCLKTDHMSYHGKKEIEDFLKTYI